jgi:hypothetical protein
MTIQSHPHLSLPRHGFRRDKEHPLADEVDHRIA